MLVQQQINNSKNGALLWMATRSELLVFGFVRNLHQIDLLPTEIVLLFVVWFGLFMDKIDEDVSDKEIKVETIEGDDPHQIRTRETSSNNSYMAAIGQSIIQKGQKQDWKMKLLSSQNQLVIGIIDDINITTRPRDAIGLYFDDELHGYGISTVTSNKYHSYNEIGTGRQIFKYATQFKIKKDDVITLTLDLSTEKSTKGLLIYHVEKASINQAPAQIQYSGEYTNIAFKVDIDRKYRLAVAFFRTNPKLALFSNI